MGKVVTFDKQRRLVRPRVDSTAAGQVIIFTGVRYERPASPEPGDGTTPLRPKRKRG